MAEMLSDQATGLRNLMNQSALQALAVPLCSGDLFGPTWAGQVALAFQNVGLRTLVLDASGGRVAQTLGLPRSRRDLIDLLSGNASFDEVAEVTPQGTHVVRAEKGLEAFVASGSAPVELLQAFAGLSHSFNVMLLVMPVAELASLMPPSSAVPVVITDATSTGIQKAYGAIKHLSTEFGFERFTLALYDVTDRSEADAIFSRLAQAASRFLNAGVTLAGWVPDRSGGPQGAKNALQKMVQSLLQHAATPVLRH